MSLASSRLPTMRACRFQWARAYSSMKVGSENAYMILGLEQERYSTNEDCIKILIENKVDLEKHERVVTKKEGIAFARQHGCRQVPRRASTGRAASTSSCRRFWTLSA
ncbi:hypothetical protein KC19_2G094500 [Ceratodon purpureus]|uniref:Uncharacterized protein n=1 Tax=Ceratodon purpureus TaxID=3225 RepID=A0A8T0IUJ8_CERPU|nr:hypothetical protein KC19_2G094500 [Ceratodon purpureus]